MSETPRTDELFRRHCAETAHPKGVAIGMGACIHRAQELLDHARQLERELAAMTAERDSLRDAVKRRDGVLDMAKRGSDRLAYECARLVMRGLLDARSGVADALLDYLSIGNADSPADVPTWVDAYERKAAKLKRVPNDRA